MAFNFDSHNPKGIIIEWDENNDFFFFFFGSTTDVGQGLPVPTYGVGFQWLIDSPP